MNSILRGFKMALLAALMAGCVGCQTLAPSAQQQLQSAPATEQPVNPEWAGPLEFFGTIFYYAGSAFGYAP